MIPNKNTAAICGLFCGTCDSFPNECHGCLSDKLTPSCAVCSNGFRDCAKAHSVIRCFECPEFPCSRLEDFSHKHIVNGVCHHENVISDLLLMKGITVDEWVKEKTIEATCQKCGQIILWHEKNLHRC